MALAWQNLPFELNLRQALIKLFFMDTMAMGNMIYTGIYRDPCSQNSEDKTCFPQFDFGIGTCFKLTCFKISCREYSLRK